MCTKGGKKLVYFTNLNLLFVFTEENLRGLVVGLIHALSGVNWTLRNLDPEGWGHLSSGGSGGHT